MCLVELGVGPAWQQAPQLVKVLLITDTDTGTGTDTDTYRHRHRHRHTHGSKDRTASNDCIAYAHTYILQIRPTHVHTAHRRHTCTYCTSDTHTCIACHSTSYHTCKYVGRHTYISSLHIHIIASSIITTAIQP
jgi:hypothetical protein